MSAMTSSMLASATARPSSTWARSRARRSSKTVRRVTTSRRWRRKASSISRSDISCGWPSSSATMLMPNTVSIGVCAYRLLSTISATSPRLSSITTRMPSLSDSSRSSEMPSICLVAHQLDDALEQPRLVDLVRQLGDDDRLAAAIVDLLELRARADRQASAAGLVGGGDFLRAVDDAGGRKIRPRHVLHQAGQRKRRIVDQRQAGVDDLGQIVRRDVGGHADRDTRGAVDQQVRHARRQDRRLVLGLVVVGYEVDRFLVDVGQQLVREPRHAHFGVAHGRRRIAVHRAEVALAVDQQVAHRERLRHAHDGVVDRHIAVRDGTCRSHRRPRAPTSCRPGCSRCRARASHAARAGAPA